MEKREDFEERMKKLGFSARKVRDLIAKAPSALKAIQEAGGKVNIQEDGVSQEFDRLHPPMEIRSLKDFTMCPECGYRQIKAEMCVKCGFLFFEKEHKRSSR
jgi:hypothetical protein